MEEIPLQVLFGFPLSIGFQDVEHLLPMKRSICFQRLVAGNLEDALGLFNEQKPRQGSHVRDRFQQLGWGLGALVSRMEEGGYSAKQ